MDQRSYRRRRPKKKRKHTTGLSKLLQELAPNFKSIASYRQLTCRQLMRLLLPLLVFSKDSGRLIKRSTKPDRHEFQRAVLATFVGFCVMGFLGFIVKLLHIPITNLIMG